MFYGFKGRVIYAAVVFVSVVFSQSTFCDETFKCKTKDGRVLFTDQPCPADRYPIQNRAGGSVHDQGEILSGKSALMQAVRQGFLQIANSSDADKWVTALKKKYELQNRQPPNIPPDLRNAYVVRKKFVYPIGLEGENSAVFYVPKGVPLPTGNYGHSKIYDLNSVTMECRATSVCGETISRGKIGAGAATTIDLGDGDSITFKDPNGAPVPRAMGSR